MHEQPGTTGPHEAADAEHLASAELKADVVQKPLHAEVVHLQHQGTGGACAAGEKVADLTAHHVLDHLSLAGFGGIAGEHGGTVAEDGHAVGDGKDLVQLVGDVDAADAALAEVAQDVEQDEHLVLGQSGGGLVEDQQAGILGQGLDDFDQLLLAHAQGTDFGRRVEGDLEAVEEGLCIAEHARPVDESAPAAGFAAKEDVFRYGHVFHQGQFLVNHGQACLASIGDGRKARLLAENLEPALIRTIRMNAGEELDQRAFASAVLPAERVDLALAQVKTHAIERDDARETLGDLVGGEEHLGEEIWEGRLSCKE